MGARDIVTNIIANDKASGPIEKVGKAADKTAGKLDEMSAADERLALEVERAGIKVEKATRAQAAAFEKYGRDSLQAREATIRLKAAQLDLADAEEKVKKHKPCEAMECVKETTKKAEGGVNGLTKAMANALPTLAKIGANVAAFGSAALSAALGVGSLVAHLAPLVVAAGHVAASMAPAAASLPALIGGIGLLKGTVMLAAPGIAKGLSSITQAFVGRLGKVGGKQTLVGGLRDELGALASKGLPELSRSFLRVNFPTIADGMKRIATAMNGVLVGVGKWVNSAPGQSAIRQIVSATATAVERLAPHVQGLAVAFGNMVARAGTGAFPRLGSILGSAADKATAFLNSISGAQVARAWTQIDGFAGAVGHFAQRIPAWGSAIMGAARWWKEHADAIRKVRDALAIIGITIGLATGGWIPVLTGSLSLIVSHWDQVSAALGRVKTWFRGTSDSASNVREVIGGLRTGVADLASWWRDHLLPALERAAHAIMPAVHDAIKMVTDTFHDNRDIIQKVQGVLSALGVVFTEAIIPAVTFLAQQALRWLGTEFSAIILILNRVVLPGLRIFTHLVLDTIGAIVHGAADIADAFGLPIAGRLKDAAGKFDKFRNQVNNALSGIKDQHVNVGATISFTPAQIVKSQLGAFGHASGGPVRGPGGPRDDQVPAMLSNGEYVVNAAAAGRHRGLLDAINSGRYMASGGLVVSTQTAGLAQTMAAERKALLAAAKAMAPSLTGSVGHIGGGVRQWAPLVLQVLALLGQPSSALGPVLSRMQRESGGNPRAINLWDSNARAGDPSRGLMQTIGGTFNAYAGPFRGRGIYDPLANIYAGVNYAIHRYGHGWISRMLAPGGYDHGGWLPPGRHMVENRTGRPEPVFSGQQWDLLRRSVQQGAHRGGGDVHVHATITATGSDIELENKLIRVLVNAGQRGRLRQLGITPS